jgi:hypothetical protein
MGIPFSKWLSCTEDDVVSYKESPQSPKPTQCIICSQYNTEQIPIFTCPYCKKTLGHVSCISYWVLTHKHCPYCTFTLV